MGSSIKTPNIGLNNWNYDDKPQMQDFNSDNAILDKEMGNRYTKTDVDSLLSKKVNVSHSTDRVAHRGILYADTNTTLSEVDLLEEALTLPIGNFLADKTVTNVPLSSWYIVQVQTMYTHRLVIATTLTATNPTMYYAVYNSGLGTWSKWMKVSATAVG